MLRPLVAVVFFDFFSTMTRLSSRFLLLFLALVCWIASGCDLLGFEDPGNPNGLTVEALEDPTRAEFGNLAAGLEAAMRTDLNQYLNDVGVIGREYYRFSSSEPRFTADLLGQEGAVLDDNTFYLTRPWNERYRAIRNAYILIETADNVDDPNILTDAEKSATKGFARTLIGYQLLMNLNLTYYNGIRVDVAGEEPGPVVANYDQALAEISAILDAANDELASGSEAFPFALSGGFEDFATPGDFATFNRALAARVALYRGDHEGALALLDDSFIDAGGDLTTGAYHVFSTDPVDIVNPFFIPPQNSGEVLAAHPSFVEDARRDGNGDIIDTRVEGPDAKVVRRNETFERANLESDWGLYVYKTQLAPIPIIRNAELLLIRAEANLLADAPDLAAVVQDLDVIREAAGLGSYTGDVTEEALLDELLYQRRYELYGEGHRWVDVRRLLAADDPNCPADTDEVPEPSATTRSTCLNAYFPVEEDGVEADAWLMFPLPQNEVEFGP